MLVEKFTPRPHQKVAFEFLVNIKSAGLFAKPGMGKTTITLMLLDHLQMLGSNFFPVLVIAPKRVCSLVWPVEARRWDAFRGLKVIPILGSVKDREDALMRKGDVYIINYDNIQWLVNRLKNRWFFRIVIADESTKLKNFRLKKQGGARAGALEDIADSVGRWINLTGSPAPNGLKDLWGQMWFIDRGARLGRSYTDFMKRWFYTDQYTKEIKPFPSAADEIYGAISDVTMALRPEDWMDVTKPNFNVIPVRLPEEAQRHYDQMEDEYFAEIGEREIEAKNAMVKSMKLVQMATGCVYDMNKVTVPVHDAKLEALEDLMDELNGENVLVVYHFNYDISRLKKRFPKFRVMDGDQDEADWNAGRVPMLGIHAQSAGHGLNLQHGGRTVIFLTNTWDLELREQVIERLGPTRQAQSGYTRVVMVYDIVAKDTMDEVILARLSGKASVQDALMAARAKRKGDTIARTKTPSLHETINMRQLVTDVSDLF